MAASFFRSLVVRAADVDRWPDAIRRMRAGEIDGIQVREVYSTADCARLCERLEEGLHGLVRSGFPTRMQAYFLGINLNLAPADLGLYFREAPKFRQDLRRLFAGCTDLQVRTSALMSALDRDRPYVAVPGPEPGIEHMFTTLRAHPAGGFIPPHFDNEQAFRPSYDLIVPLIGADLFSFVLAFSQPHAGGALEVFNLHHQGRAFRMADGPDDAERLDLSVAESVRFVLEPGEMILFNSGRLLHRVTPVEGEQTRWTACSFMAESRAGDRVYCWG